MKELDLVAYGSHPLWEKPNRRTSFTAVSNILHVLELPILLLSITNRYTAEHIYLR